MACFYQILKKFNPQDTSETRYTAAVKLIGYLDAADLAKQVGNRDGHTVGQLEGLFQDYFQKIYEHVLLGQSVSMDPIGTIVPYLNGIGAETADDYTTDYITRIHLTFRPSAATKAALRPESEGGTTEIKKWGEE